MEMSVLRKIDSPYILKIWQFPNSPLIAEAPKFPTQKPSSQTSQKSTPHNTFPPRGTANLASRTATSTTERRSYTRSKTQAITIEDLRHESNENVNSGVIIDEEHPRLSVSQIRQNLLEQQRNSQSTTRLLEIFAPVNLGKIMLFFVFLRRLLKKSFLIRSPSNT